MSLEVLVRESIKNFLSHKISSDFDLSIVDDVVLGYLISVLEEIDDDENFDVDEFIDVMTAYIPGFEQVERDVIYSWLFDLASQLTERKTQNSADKNQELQEARISKTSTVQVNNACQPCDKTTSSSLSQPKQTDNNQETEESNLSENVPVESVNSFTPNSTLSSDMNDQIQTLQELFPDACSLKLTHCLSVANGNLDQAAQLLLLKSEEHNEGEQLDSVDNPSLSSVAVVPDFQTQLHKPSAKREDLCDVEKDRLKNELISKYSYIDVESDKRVHRPVVSRKDEKTLIRYRNNHVVTTKGEKIFIEKSTESDEMKKTYINLKPARKYRFH